MRQGEQMQPRAIAEKHHFCFQEIVDRDATLRAETWHAMSDRDEAVMKMNDATRETERWKKEALTHAKKLKDSEQRLQQLDLRHNEDKARMRVLAEQLCAAPASTDANRKNDGKDGGQSIGRATAGAGNVNVDRGGLA